MVEFSARSLSMASRVFIAIVANFSDRCTAFSALIAKHTQTWIHTSNKRFRFYVISKSHYNKRQQVKKYQPLIGRNLASCVESNNWLSKIGGPKLDTPLARITAMLQKKNWELNYLFVCQTESRYYLSTTYYNTSVHKNLYFASLLFTSWGRTMMKTCWKFDTNVLAENGWEPGSWNTMVTISLPMWHLRSIWWHTNINHILIKMKLNVN